VDGPHRTVAQEILEAARRVAEALAPPAVARVLVPGPELGAEHHGSFCAVTLEDGSTGLCFLLGDTLERLRAGTPARWVGQPVAELAAAFTQGDDGERSLALAAINAITRHLWRRAGYEPDFATSSLGSLAFGPGDRVGMVGFFPPLVKRAREAGVPLTVVELKPELVQESPDLTVTLDPGRLAGCTVVVSTSTVLLNASLEGLLAHARGAREFVLIGPSAGCLPDPLFARGVTAVGGAWVTDPIALLERARRGERWGDATRKFSIRREGWPGLEELLRRAKA
jgi:uncharacterized protein (DUF4213/DUF364 family)